MSFNRLSYDNCEQKKHLNESVSPGLYQINTPVMCNTCFQNNPQIINQRGSVSMDANKDWRFYAGPVDVESDLLNINRPNTKCSEGKYEPNCPNCGVVTSGQPCGDGVSLSCHNCKHKIIKGGMCNNTNLVDLPNCNFPIENTRLSNPPSTLRGTGWNRFENLCFDPQDQLFFPGKYHIMTRLESKDNHRMCPRKFAINSMHPMDHDKTYDVNNVCNSGIQDSRYATPLSLRQSGCK